MLEQHVHDAHMRDKSHKTAHQMIEHQCNECEVKFKTESELKTHRKTAHQRTEQQCGKSEVKFDNKYELKNHRETAHQMTEHQCNECEAKFTTEYELKKHKETAHQRTEHQCDKHKIKVRNRSELKTHRKTAHQMTEHHCVICNIAIDQKTEMNRHKGTVHVGDNDRQISSLQMFKCSECLDKVQNEENLHRHTADKQEYGQTVLDYSATNGQGSVWCPCVQCHTISANKIPLTNHLKQIHETSNSAPVKGWGSN